MKLLNKDLDLEAFFQRVHTASERILMLDYDGTLAPFRPERDQAVPYPGVRERLTRILSAGSTRLVIVSGRAVSDLTPLLRLDALPEIWGSHGAEQLMPDGRYHSASSEKRPAEGLDAAYWWAREQGLLETTERKPVGIAFHWRGKAADEIDSIRTAISDRWRDSAADFGLVLREFDGGLELRVEGITKGEAVRRIAGGSISNSAVAYLGDDETDEDAFRALPEHGLAVLVRSELRESAADVWLQPPAEMLAFLDRWAVSGRG
ncbi:MAG: trehalose-phosphatase [candidate division Zixibacteria bacterium]|jgi:trehalose-phosphatase|nr:trehalose-phosphatase [candidate division Zixibacteria bacterium]